MAADSITLHLHLPVHIPQLKPGRVSFPRTSNSDWLSLKAKNNNNLAGNQLITDSGRTFFSFFFFYVFNSAKILSGTFVFFPFFIEPKDSTK